MELSDFSIIATVKERRAFNCRKRGRVARILEQGYDQIIWSMNGWIAYKVSSKTRNHMCHFYMTACQYQVINLIFFLFNRRRY